MDEIEINTEYSLLGVETESLASLLRDKASFRDSVPYQTKAKKIAGTNYGEVLHNAFVVFDKIKKQVRQAKLSVYNWFESNLPKD